MYLLSATMLREGNREKRFNIKRAARVSTERGQPTFVRHCAHDM